MFKNKFKISYLLFVLALVASFVLGSSGTVMLLNQTNPAVVTEEAPAEDTWEDGYAQCEADFAAEVEVVEVPHEGDDVIENKIITITEESGLGDSTLISEDPFVQIKLIHYEKDFDDIVIEINFGTSNTNYDSYEATITKGSWQQFDEAGLDGYRLDFLYTESTYKPTLEVILVAVDIEDPAAEEPNPTIETEPVLDQCVTMTLEEEKESNPYPISFYVEDPQSIWYDGVHPLTLDQYIDAYGYLIKLISYTDTSTTVDFCLISVTTKYLPGFWLGSYEKMTEALRFETDHINLGNWIQVDITNAKAQFLAERYSENFTKVHGYLAVNSHNYPVTLVIGEEFEIDVSDVTESDHLYTRTVWLRYNGEGLPLNYVDITTHGFIVESNGTLYEIQFPELTAEELLDNPSLDIDKVY